MSREGELRAARSADTEVFYMAGRQLAALARRLREAGWATDTAVAVVSRAGCIDALASSHRIDTLAEAAVLHAGRPTVVTVGVGAEALPAPVVTPATAQAAPDPTPCAAATELERR
jgi:uroporphyrin-III C-methyltransferase